MKLQNSKRPGIIGTWVSWEWDIHTMHPVTKTTHKMMMTLCSSGLQDARCPHNTII